MSSMDEYARKQVIVNNLEASLRDLYKERTSTLNELVKIDKQIEKHINYLERLRDED